MGKRSGIWSRPPKRLASTRSPLQGGSPGAYKWVAPWLGQGHGLHVRDHRRTLMTRIRQELGTAARHAKVAHDICENVSDFYVPKEHDPEAISAGTYLDFEAQMYDQAAEERGDQALDHIEALQKHGTPEQIKEAWDLYLKYQTGEWEVPKWCDAEINMPETEQGGSHEH